MSPLILRGGNQTADGSGRQLRQRNRLPKEPHELRPIRVKRISFTGKQTAHFCIVTLPFPLCSLRSFVTRFFCGERFAGAAVSQVVGQIYGPAFDGGRRIFPPETAQIRIREKVMSMDQVRLFLRGETVRELLDMKK